MNNNIPTGYESVEDERPWLSYCEIHDRGHDEGCPDCYEEDIYNSEN